MQMFMLFHGMYTGSKNLLLMDLSDWVFRFAAIPKQYVVVCKKKKNLWDCFGEFQFGENKKAAMLSVYQWPYLPSFFVFHCLFL